LEKINKKDAFKINSKIKDMEENLKGDIKKLTNYSPEFRLRIGNFRVLFELVGDKIIIYRIKHRKDPYR